MRKIVSKSLLAALLIAMLFFITGFSVSWAEENRHISNDVKQAEIMEEEMGFLYIESAEIESPCVQNIAVSWDESLVQISKMTLIYIDNEGTKHELEESNRTDNSVLFTKEFSSNEVGEYTIKGVNYYIGEEEYAFNFDSVKIKASFDVVNNIEDSIENNIATVEITEDEDIASNIEKQVEETFSAAVINEESIKEKAASGRNIVVVLDPGHGGSDPGAVNKSYGIQEATLNMKIAHYCKAELEEYSGVEVYLTHTGNGFNGSTAQALQGRVDVAKSKNADILVSIHINAGGGTGAEVYMPNENYDYDAHVEGKGVSSEIIKELESLGLYNRGVKIRNSEDNTLYPNGDLADYYGIIRRSKLAGFPGIIVEHAFIDNSNDASYLSSEESLKRIGIADATGIAKYYELSKEPPTLVVVDGKFYCYSGNKLLTGEQIIDSKWYHFDKDSGQMTVGWYDFPEKRVYYSEDGAMVYGKQVIDGRTYYFDESTGALCQMGEMRIEGKWYHFDKTNGEMAIGWYDLPEKRVYYGEDGAMVYGKQVIDGKTYYFDVITGALVEGKEKYISGKWYYLEKGTGEVSKGWVNLPEKRVYYDEDGAMVYGKQVIDGKTYYFNIITGALVEGKEKYISGKWYYLEKGTGEVSKGWVNLPEKRVYYDEDGAMVYGKQVIDGKTYYFNIITGALVEGKEKYISGKWHYFKTGTGEMAIGWVDLPEKRVYYDEDGAMVYGIQVIDGKTYYFNIITGALVEGKEKYISGKWYYLEKGTGEVSKGWVNLPEKRVYYDEDGAMVYGKQIIDGKTYYFNIITGALVEGKEKYISGKWHYFKTGTGEMAIGWVDLPGKRVYYDEDGAMVYGKQEIDGKIYYFDIITGAVQEEYLNIAGSSNVTVEQLINYYNAKNKRYPSEIYEKKGSPDIETFCRIYYEEAEAEGIKVEIAFCQAMKETGWLQFGGNVKIEQCNFAGIGAIGGTENGASFLDVRTGVRAHIQHLKAYANNKPLNNNCVDPRFKLVHRGCAPYVEWLGQNENPLGKGWATSVGYGYSIKKMINEIK